MDIEKMFKGKDYEKMKAQKKVMDMILDIMYEATDDKQILYFRKAQAFGNKLSSIASIRSVTDEQCQKLIIIVKKFDEVLDEFLSQEGIELEEEDDE